MVFRILAVGALLLGAGAVGCDDRTPVSVPAGPAGPAGAAAAVTTSPEALARMVAKGLKNAAFRAYLKAQLDASPYGEHKLQFETFAARNVSNCSLCSP